MPKQGHLNSEFSNRVVIAQRRSLGRSLGTAQAKARGSGEATTMVDEYRVSHTSWCMRHCESSYTSFSINVPIHTALSRMLQLARCLECSSHYMPQSA